jgi:hypothetical protein
MSNLVSPTTPIATSPNHFHPPVGCSFFARDFERMIRLLSDNPSKELNTSLATLLDALGVLEWADLMAETPESVEEANEKMDVEGDRLSGNTMKKLKYMVRYAHTNDKLGDDVTLRHIIQCVDSLSGASNVIPVNNCTDVTTTTINEKMLPKLEKFSGNDKDFVKWRNTTLHAFGKVGLKAFLLDEI